MKKIMMIVAFGTSLFADSFEYECQDGYRFKATQNKAGMQLTLPRQTLNLVQVPSASGVKYSDGTVTFFTKGDDALFAPDALGSMACRVIEKSVSVEPIVAAAAIAEKKTASAAPSFHASGTRPVWELQIDANNHARITFAEEAPMALNLPRGFESGDSTLYLLKDPRMMIERHHRRCMLDEGGEARSEIVTIRYAGHVYKGCGGS